MTVTRLALLLYGIGAAYSAVQLVDVSGRVWEVHQDDTTGMEYYYNKASKTTTWTQPEEVGGESDSAEAAAEDEPEGAFSGVDPTTGLR